MDKDARVFCLGRGLINLRGPGGERCYRYRSVIGRTLANVVFVNLRSPKGFKTQPSELGDYLICDKRSKM